MNYYWSGVRCTAWRLADSLLTFVDHAFNHTICRTTLGYRMTNLLAGRAIDEQDAMNALMGEVPA